MTFDLFESGHNCVGKYADLTNLQEDYKMALYYWLRYLDIGKSQHADVDICNKTIEELQNELQKHYADSQ